MIISDQILCTTQGFYFKAGFRHTLHLKHNHFSHFQTHTVTELHIISFASERDRTRSPKALLFHGSSLQQPRLLHLPLRRSAFVRRLPLLLLLRRRVGAAARAARGDRGGHRVEAGQREGRAEGNHEAAESVAGDAGARRRSRDFSHTGAQGHLGPH